MDQVKIGQFIRSLRREKKMTQEELAQEMNVSRRTVSRWETGYNMPDLATLIDIADYFEVDVRELLDGERKGGIMNKEVKETIEMAASYAEEEKKKEIKKRMITFIVGYVCLLIGMLIERLNSTSLTGTLVLDYLSGFCYGFSIVIFIFSIIYFAKAK